MLQSYHQNAEQFEILFNKDKFNGLPAKLKAIIENAVEAANSDMWWKSIDRGSKDYIWLQTEGKVKFYKTPDAILQKQLEIFDQIAERKSAENPMFKEILESQRAFAKRAVAWDMDYNVGRRMPIIITLAPRRLQRRKAKGITIISISHPGAASVRVVVSKRIEYAEITNYH